MSLDVPTLTAMVFVNALAMALALTAAGNFRSTPGTTAWVWGAWMQAVGWACLIAGYRSGMFWLLSCAAVSFSASLSLAHRSVRSFTGLDSTPWWLYAAPLGVAVLHPAAQWLGNPSLRIEVVALITFLQSAFIVLSIIRGPRLRIDRWRWLLVCTMGSTAALALLKMIDSALHRDPTLQSSDLMNVVGLIVGTINVNLNSLSLLLAQRADAQHRLEVLATTDVLTGLANRRSLIEAGERHFLEAAQSNTSLTVVMIDLDFFKSVNDSYGHLVGDEVLSKFGALLRQNVRRPDIVGRFGGEEFCILMPGSGTEAALSMDRRLRDALAQQPFSQPLLQPTYSAGAAQVTRADASFSALLGRADTLLYLAKDNGRSRMALS